MGNIHRKKVTGEADEEVPEDDVAGGQNCTRPYRRRIENTRR
jgi:hypothetical protein